ncbi:MAG: ribbon-helix-helix domain-containing protein [Nanoarchaeota archaeon]|nr:ribbon-helix-helix domain-containing protein [Nanoarchaeota archaeon]
MKLINLKLSDTFLEKIDETAKEFHYHNRTEFIRAAIREKIEQLNFMQNENEFNVKDNIEKIKPEYTG